MEKDFRLAPEPAGRPAGDFDPPAGGEERLEEEPPPAASRPPREAKALAARPRVRCQVCDASGRVAPGIPVSMFAMPQSCPRQASRSL